MARKRRRRKRGKDLGKKIPRKIGISLMNYGFMTLITFAANLGTTTYCHEYLHLDKRTSYLAAIVVVFLVTFIGLRYVVYSETRMKLKKQFSRYLIASGFLWLVEYAMFVYLAVRINYEYRIVILVLTAISCLVRFLVLRHLVFKRR